MTKDNRQRNELNAFKDQISALIEFDPHELIRTGLVNQKNYRYDDYGDMLTSQDVNKIIEETFDKVASFPVKLMTASEIHDTFNFCGFKPIEGGKDNILHAIKLFDGSEVIGYIFIDDTTDNQLTAIHMAFDKEYSKSAIYSFRTEIDDFSMSFYSMLNLPHDKETELARSLKVKELLTRKKDQTYESLDPTDQILLLSIMNESDFETKQEYEQTAASRVDIAIYNSGYDHNTINMIGDLLTKGNGEINYVIVDYKSNEPEARTVIIEKAGNVLISNQDQQLFKYAEGESFDFKGETYIAGKDVTNDIELVLCGTNSTISNLKNSKLDETNKPEPVEQKRKNKFKP